MINDTITPSWTQRVRPNFGDASAGSLKADEWRSLITIYIPIALVSIWGASSSHPLISTRMYLRRLLDHTMLLVQATILVCSRSMTTYRAAMYHSYISRYVSQIKALYPNAGFRPNHHLLLHLKDCLLLFGPVHGWWAFSLEWLNGLLQRLNTNLQRRGLGLAQDNWWTKLWRSRYIYYILIPTFFAKRSKVKDFCILMVSLSVLLIKFNEVQFWLAVNLKEKHNSWALLNRCILS